MGSKIGLAVIMIFTSLFALHEEVIVPLPDLMKPGSLIVKENTAYITEKNTIRTFDLNSGQLINSFGKKGEGPGEFIGVIKIHPVDNGIMVSSTGKISIFTLSGILIVEKTVNTNSGIAGNFQPFGKGFVGMSSAVDKISGYRTINIFDKNLKKVREIYRSNIGTKFDSSVGKNNFFKKSFSFRVIGSNIYISGDEGFRINVFNKNGNSLFTIKRNYKKIPFTSIDKKNFLNYLKLNSPDYVYQNTARRLIFPEYYPSIFFLYSDGQILYVFTWKKNENGLEAFLYNAGGEFISRKEIPIKFAGPVIFYPFTIKDKKVYQLIEDEEELWELHITNL